KLTVNLGQGTNPAFLAIQPDGRIILTGDAVVTQTVGFAVARFLNDNPSSDANQRFVTHLYLDLLERTPELAGLTMFTAALNQGQLTRAQVVQAITNSLEYHTLEVVGTYGRLLGRPAEPFGLNNWLSFMNACVT